MRRRGLRTRTKAIAVALAAIALLVVWAVLARGFAPQGNTAAGRFDAIIVLGVPADGEGNPSPGQLARVTEAVHEYERGVAPRLILTGGAAHNKFVEAQVMARTAEAQGVPSEAIVVEPEALDTIQNACYSTRIMRGHGWKSAEVISAPTHLPRAGIIFSHLPLQWRTHAAPSLEPEGGSSRPGEAAVEVLKTVRYLIYARWAEPCPL